MFNIRKKIAMLAISILALFSVGNSFGESKKPLFIAAQFSDIHLRKQCDSVNRFQKFVKKVRKDNPNISMILNTGDVLDGHKGLWSFWTDSVKNTMSDLPIFSVLGNHDDEADIKDVKEVCKLLKMPNRYYSFDRPPYRFIVLDGNTIKHEQRQLEWLEDNLEKTPKNKHVVVLCHQPIKHNKKITKILSSYPNVKLCLTGHTHRHVKAVVDGVVYINGGAVSGFWWEQAPKAELTERQKKLAAGYGLIKFYADGTFKYDYIKHNL